jgi:hypothetical protein
VIDLDAAALREAYERIAPALGLAPRASEAALRVAIREADHLVDDLYDVPAALLFALGRTPRCFAGFRTMSVLLVAWQTKRLGYRLEASPRDLAEMLLRVARREVVYEDVRSWVGGRLLPFGG